jgi:hypothetical protein
MQTKHRILCKLSMNNLKLQAHKLICAVFQIYKKAIKFKKIARDG